MLRTAVTRRRRIARKARLFVRPSVHSSALVYKRAEKSREESSSENQLPSLSIRIRAFVSQHEGNW